jgi:ASC-1-like (ASCH) protein
MEPKSHVMKLQAYSFDKIRDGEKTIEVRLYDEKRREINLGDEIAFKREPEQTETVKTEVVGLLNYKSFEDLVEDFPASDFGYSDKTELLNAIYSFYKKEDVAKYSVLGIKIKLVK